MLLRFLTMDVAHRSAAEYKEAGHDKFGLLNQLLRPVEEGQPKGYQVLCE